MGIEFKSLEGTDCEILTFKDLKRIGIETVFDKSSRLLVDKYYVKAFDEKNELNIEVPIDEPTFTKISYEWCKWVKNNFRTFKDVNGMSIELNKSDNIKPQILYVVKTNGESYKFTKAEFKKIRNFLEE